MAEHGREEVMGMSSWVLWGQLALVADAWTIVNILQSRADTGKKVLWIVIVLVLPILGVILWYSLGRKITKR
jgi:thiol:disulfide interchange protein